MADDHLVSDVIIIIIFVIIIWCPGTKITWSCCWCNILSKTFLGGKSESGQHQQKRSPGEGKYVRLAPLEWFKVIFLILGVCSVQSNQEVAHKSVTATGLPAFAQNSSNPGKSIK